MGQGNCLTDGQANQERASQPGTISGCDRVDVFPSAAGLLEGSFNYRKDRGELLARGYLGHDASVAIMNFDLRGDHVREQITPVPDERGSRFVARAFDS